jgi:predicted Zn-dependent protease
VRAECLTGLRRTADAVAVLDRGLAAHPGDPRLLRLRSEAHLAADAPKEAAALLEKAAAADPYDARVRYQLTLAYNGLGRATDAAAEQRRFDAIQKDRTRRTDLEREAMKRPWDAGVRRELAAVCDRLGRPKLAVMWRQAADACPPPGTAVTP